MHICIAGLWHLGTVTAACLASAGHTVTGFDDDAGRIDALKEGRAPVHEPGLEELLRSCRLEVGPRAPDQLTDSSSPDLFGVEPRPQTPRLSFTADPVQALAAAEVLWITWDTPVDEDDRADVEAVVGRVEALLPHLSAGALVIVSSQVPVGTTARIEARCAALRPDAGIVFACLPENLRLGSAIETFTRPDRVVAGTRGTRGQKKIIALLAPFSPRIEWMSVESAEMTKHALNAFLATSVAFANEIAAVSERVGADAAEVARGLKSDARIGPRAYVSPGAAFSGGTLARDVVFLTERGAELGLPLHLIAAARESNEAHREWTVQRLESALGGLEGRTVAVWGLTYKPGTNTLRRSGSVALCRSLSGRGAKLRLFDPAIGELPNHLAAIATLAGTPTEAARGAQALVVATEWPVFREVSADDLVAVGAPIVLDPGRFLAKTLGADCRLGYLAVGSPSR